MFDLIVNTKNGSVGGVKSHDYKGGEFYCFYGIPYARPPLGELRFKAPEPPDRWTGILNCSKPRDGCISRHLLTAKFTGSEDCLYVNVYTKSFDSKPKPVFVWIHGGVFITGSGNPDVFGPEFLMTQDIVLVTLNYRLGPFGFLCLEDDTLGVPGNAGIRDVLMALKWVNRNVANFNGDVNNVTIGGQSSGGVIANFLLLTPKAKGLFHRAIIQSACALQTWAIGKRDGAKELAKLLGCDSDSEKEILDFLRTVPAEEISKAFSKIRVVSDDIYADNVLSFNPVVEKPSEEAILTELPIITLKKGNYIKVPLLMGYTSKEGTYAIFLIRNKKIIIENAERMIPHNLKLNKGTHISKLTARKINKFYFGDETSPITDKDKFMEMSTFPFFAYPVYRLAKYIRRTSNQPIYFYKFSADTELNIYKSIRKYKSAGASHSDDICYLFTNMLTPKITPGSVEDLTVTRMTRLWGNFVRCGNPNPTDSDVFWKPMEEGAKHFIEITNDGLFERENPDERDMNFWDEIYKLDPTYFNHKL